MPARENTVRIRGTKSKQDRLRSHLLGEIATGVLGPGDILVPERQLAELMQVSRTTVRQTLDDRFIVETWSPPQAVQEGATA